MQIIKTKCQCHNEVDWKISVISFSNKTSVQESANSREVAFECGFFKLSSFYRFFFPDREGRRENDQSVSGP